MVFAWIVMTLIVLLGVLVGAVVVIGIAGAGEREYPKLNHTLTKAARLVSGEAPTPKFFDELAEKTNRHSQGRAA